MWQQFSRTLPFVTDSPIQTSEGRHVLVAAGVVVTAESHPRIHTALQADNSSRPHYAWVCGQLIMSKRQNSVAGSLVKHPKPKLKAYGICIYDYFFSIENYQGWQISFLYNAFRTQFGCRIKTKHNNIFKKNLRRPLPWTLLSRAGFA